MDELTMHLNARIEEINQIKGLPAESLSKYHESIENDTEKKTRLLPSSKLPLRYIRNTNSAYIYKQKGGRCYAFSACSAAWNTIMRIPYYEKVPSMKELYDIAEYNKGNGGEPLKSIELIENELHLGIRCEKVSSVSIKDILTLSVIISFTTSKEGWKQVANGELLRYPGGVKDGWHAVLVEGYDLEKDCLICKNSWGIDSAKARFDLAPSATHDFEFVLVYYTDRSITGKTTKKFVPKMKKYKKWLYGELIDCAWMDEETATYTTEYVCEIHHEKHDEYNYLGYDVEQWIAINLNREKGQKYSNHFLINSILKIKDLLKLLCK